MLTEYDRTSICLFSCGHYSWASHETRAPKLGDVLFCAYCYVGNKPIKYAMREVVGIGTEDTILKPKPIAFGDAP